MTQLRYVNYYVRTLLLLEPKENNTNRKSEISLRRIESESETAWMRKSLNRQRRCLCFHVTRLRITFNLSYFTYSLAGFMFWIQLLKGNKLFIHLHFQLTDDVAAVAVSVVDYSTCQCNIIVKSNWAIN